MLSSSGNFWRLKIGDLWLIIQLIAMEVAIGNLVVDKVSFHNLYLANRFNGLIFLLLF